MKINIISCQGSLIYGNFGSALQAHALQAVLKQLGHEPLLILSMNFPLRGFPEWVETIYSSLRFVCPVARRMVDALRLRVSQVGGSRERRRHFADFVKRHICTTPLGYTCKERINHLPKADAYICGSDQIWGSGAGDMSYFFPAQERRKCLSYAASGSWALLGRDNQWVEKVGPYLREFRAVGVRETDGVALCKRAGVSTVMATIDPTMLLPCSHYESIMPAEPIVKEPYLLFYMLNMTSAADVPLETAKRYCAEHKLRLVILSGQGTEQQLPSELNDSTGPLEFLNLIKHASAVITNSFHGSVFCVLFQTPYLVCLQQGKTAAENARFHSAHTKLGQAARIGTKEILDVNQLQIVPSAALPLLEAWKEESYAFLQGALNAIATE